MRFVVVFVVVILGLAPMQACGVADEKADGTACGSDDDCKSKSCREGYCAGSDCSKDACGTGWKCVHSDADPITGYFGNTGVSTCAATCGSCPGNQYCTKDDAPGETLCHYGKAPLEIAIHAPQGVVGRAVHVTATEATGIPLVECEWEVGDGKPTEKTGPELVRSFQAAQTYWVRATCKEAGGRVGTGQGTIDVVPG